MNHFGQTARTDLWWVRPLLIFIGLFSFILYATWAAFQGEHYAIGPYISPFYSPEKFTSCGCSLREKAFFDNIGSPRRTETPSSVSMDDD